MDKIEHAKAILRGRRSSYPHPTERGKRIVGWVVDLEMVGTMQALEVIEAAATAHFKSS